MFYYSLVQLHHDRVVYIVWASSKNAHSHTFIHSQLRKHANTHSAHQIQILSNFERCFFFPSPWSRAELSRAWPLSRSIAVCRSTQLLRRLIRVLGTSPLSNLAVCFECESRSFVRKSITRNESQSIVNIIVSGWGRISPPSSFDRVGREFCSRVDTCGTCWPRQVNVVKRGPTITVRIASFCCGFGIQVCLCVCCVYPQTKVRETVHVWPFHRVWCFYLS